jgi:general secretion pathway protein L
MERANPGLRQTLRNAAQRSGLRAFWQWWIGELAPMVPAGPRNALRRRRLRPILALDADTAVMWVPRTADGVLTFTESARIALSGDPAAVAKAGREAVDALPRISYGGSVAEAKLVVALPPGQVLRKTITLPAAVEESLEQALAFDLDRHTPFKPDEVYFDAVVIGRDSAKKEIRVDWAAALRSVVDQACRRAESWGATVVGVTPEAPVGAAALAGTTLNLLPEEDRPNGVGRRRLGLWAPLALVAAVALLAVALPVWQKRGYAIALMQLANQARVQADASNALRMQLEQLTDDYNFALQRKYAFPAAMQLVDDVTRVLPDDTWLTQLEVKTTARGKDPRRELGLRGESGNAGLLISLLEESKAFEQAAPRSPTTKIQPGPGEIFDVAAQLKALPLPRLVPLESTPGKDAAPSAAAAAPTTPPAAAAPATPAAASAAPPAPTSAPASSPTPAPARPAEAPAAAPATPPKRPETPVPAPPARPPAATPAPQPAKPGAAPPATGGAPDDSPVPGDDVRLWRETPTFARSGRALPRAGEAS